MAKRYRSRHVPRDPLGFVPVPRKTARHDGWTAAVQRSFIATLAATGNVKASAMACGRSWVAAYQLRRAEGAESFRAAWDAAVEIGTAQIRDILIDHSINGVPEPIVHGGKIVGERRKFNHQTMRAMIEQRGDGPGAGRRRRGEPQPDPAETQRLRDEITQRLERLHVSLLTNHIDDPSRRAAYERLHGPVDWDTERANIGRLARGERLVWDRGGEPAPPDGHDRSEDPLGARTRPDSFPA